MSMRRIALGAKAGVPFRLTLALAVALPPGSRVQVPPPAAASQHARMDTKWEQAMKPGDGANGLSLNRDLVLQRIQEIRGALALLQVDATRPPSAFVADAQVVDAAKYRLLVAIEAAVSICTHVASRLAGRTPDSYADCFAVLGGAGIVPTDLAERLGRMARFRNRLVHLYWKIDNERVWEVLRESLGDLEAYLDAIGALIEGRRA
jgi:uncharacterized protein YutE (UPF0331/DUF86 family)